MDQSSVGGFYRAAGARVAPGELTPVPGLQNIRLQPTAKLSRSESKRVLVRPEAKAMLSPWRALIGMPRVNFKYRRRLSSPLRTPLISERPPQA